MADGQAPGKDDLTSVTEPESEDPAYLAWKEAKIAAALKHAEQCPDDLLPLDEVWRNAIEN